MYNLTAFVVLNDRNNILQPGAQSLYDKPGPLYIARQISAQLTGSICLTPFDR